MSREDKFLKIIMLAAVVVLLSSCTGYKSSFGCPSSKGANCMPMDMVDSMISNGQIEEFNEKYKKKHCNKNSCYHNVKNGNE